MREMLSLFALASPVDRKTVWESWLRFCLEQEERFGFTFTHLGCETASLHPSGIRTRSRYLKKVEASAAQKEPITNIEFYLLPKEFRQAVFDFRVFMALTLGEQRSYCEITVERQFPEGFQYQNPSGPFGSFCGSKRQRSTSCPLTRPLTTMSTAFSPPPPAPWNGITD